MNNLLRSLKKTVKKLQNSSETARKFWLVVLSAAAMIIILGLWVLYINGNIIKVIPVVENDSPEPADKKPGIFATFSAGLQTLTAQIKDKISAPNSWSFQKQEQNFLSEKVRPIPPTKLP
jgi:hypothetical protein